MGPPLKLNMAKVKTEDVSRASSPATPSVQTPGGTGLKLRFNKPATPASAAAASSASKKRTSDAAAIPEDGPAAKKSKTTTIKTKGPAITINTDEAPVRKPSQVLKLKSHKDSISTPTTPRGIKVKFKGKLPTRPIGAGYDSECDEAEPDPAIEENFILRMAPGADADYIRKAIEERKLGVPLREGGADVSLRFFTKDARRAMVRVQDRFYAAVLVDLPCITESMKSWDKKGWWKSADISQMLLVTQRVDNADKAKDVPLPKEINKDSYAWPHGLTPPMHDVRRRRFRKRNDYKSVEKLEEEVERLLAEDQKARAMGGTSETKVMTMAEWDREQNPPSESEESDAEGDYDNEDYGYEDEEEELDPEALANLNAIWADDDDEQPADTSTVAAPAQAATAPQTIEVDRSGSTLDINGPTQTVTTPNGGTAEVSLEVVPETQPDATMADAGTPSAISQAIISTPGASPSNEAASPAADNAGAGAASGSASTHSSDDSDGSNSDDDASASASDEEEMSEEAREARERRLQQKAEIEHLEGEIEKEKQKLAKTGSAPMQKRIRDAIKRFENDRDVKKRGLGLPVGDEEGE